MLGPVSWLLGFPLIAALITFFVPKHSVTLIRRIALIGTGLSLLTAICVFVQYDHIQGGYQFIDKIPWVKSFGIDYHVGVDGINAVLLLLTAFCSFTGIIAAGSIQKRIKEYYIFYLFLVVGCFGVLSSLNIFFMYFFYELAVIPVYPLIAVWGSGNKEYASLKLTLYLTLGALLALFAIFGIYWQAGLNSFNFVLLERVLAQSPLPLGFQQCAFGFIMVGFGVILTLWPFHTWSPMGYAAAPTSVSMLHAGVLKKLGAYMIIRLGLTLLPDGAHAWMPLIATLACVNIVYCGLVAFRQNDLKYILGYSSCSHMGFILLGLACMSPVALNGTIYFMFAHGIMAALGFGLVGFIYDQTHTRMLSDWGGFGKKMPFVSTIFVMSALASSGVPGFANFIGELLILIGAWQKYPLHAILAVSGLVITAGFMLKTVRGAIQGPLDARWGNLKDAVGLAKFPFALLILVLLITGLVPQILMPKIVSGTENVLGREAKVEVKVVFTHEQVQP